MYIYIGNLLAVCRVTDAPFELSIYNTSTNLGADLATAFGSVPADRAVQYVISSKKFVLSLLNEEPEYSYTCRRANVNITGHTRRAKK